jgi:hypothetical protein
MKTTTDPLLQLGVTSRTLLIARSRAAIWWFHKVVNKEKKELFVSSTLDLQLHDRHKIMSRYSTGLHSSSTSGDSS